MNSVNRKGEEEGRVGGDARGRQRVAKEGGGRSEDATTLGRKRPNFSSIKLPSPNHPLSLSMAPAVANSSANKKKIKAYLGLDNWSILFKFINKKRIFFIYEISSVVTHLNLIFESSPTTTNRWQVKSVKQDTTRRTVGSRKANMNCW